MTARAALAAATLLAAAGATAAPAPAQAPHLRRQGTAQQLIVDGQPFLIRGGELGNSSGEPAYLRPFWPRLKALNLNTVLVPVYWDQVEPAEGRFDFATVDGLLADARAHGMRLVLLWFGSWKNSMSCYAPSWVKRDPRRFPRARDGSGRSVEILSAFAPANVEADARAFTALLKHLRAADGEKRTVIMVQVENEVGMIPDARDRSPAADAAFARPVPAELMAALATPAAESDELRRLWQRAGGRPSGTWAEVFGAGAAGEEVFTAWHLARFTQQVAAAGKAEYALPFFANAALIRPGYQPGQYPSGGPLPHLAAVWRVAAPAIDFIAPDIYFANFTEWARRYVRAGQPLFVPEALRSPEAAANALYAFGAHDAIGFCPFAIESITEPSAGALTAAYDLVAQLTPLLVQHQGRGTTAGLVFEGPENRTGQQVRLGGYALHALFERTSGPQLADGVVVAVGGAAPAGASPTPAGGLVIASGPDEMIVAGAGVTVTFSSLEPGQNVGLLSVEEGRYEDGQWRHLRWLNGDQTHQGRHVRLEPGRFGIQKVTLYRY
jgi:beta-galactosidase GanA